LQTLNLTLPKLTKWIVLGIAAVGILLVLVGLTMYLRPVEYLGVVEHDENRQLIIELSPRNSSEIWGKSREDALWLNWSLNISIKAFENRKVDFYVFNETEYIKKQQGYQFEWILYEANTSNIQINLKPLQSTKYCFFFDNTHYNDSKTIELESLFRASVPSYDFEGSFTWLRIACVGLLLFIPSIGFTLYSNRKKLLAILKYDIFPRSGHTRIGLNHKKLVYGTFYVLVIVPSIYSVTIMISGYLEISSVAWPENLPIYTDVLIRFLLEVLLLVLQLALLYLIIIVIIGILTNILFTKLSIKSAIDQQLMLSLDEKAFTSYFDSLKSPKLLSIIVILSLLFYFLCLLLPTHEFSLFLTFGCVFSALSGFTLFQSYRRVSGMLQLDFVEVLHLRKHIFLVSRSIQLGVFLVLMILLRAYHLIAVPTYDLVWANCPALDYWSEFFQMSRGGFVMLASSVWELFAPYFWGSVLSLVGFSAVFDYLLPRVVQTGSLSKAMKSLLFDGLVFMASFVLKIVLTFVYENQLKPLDSVIFALIVAVSCAVMVKVFEPFKRSDRE